MANLLHLAEISQSVLDVAYDGLASTSTGQPNEAYISHNAPAVDCCDILVVYAEFIRPSIGMGFNAQYVTGGRVLNQCNNLGRVLDLVIELWRPCFPTVVDNAYHPFPATEDTDAAARALLEDAWALQCSLIGAACDGSIWPDSVSRDCLDMAWGDMQPLGPQGGCAGWRWLLTFELDMSTCGS